MKETLEEAAFIAGEESFKEFRKGILEPNRFDFVCGFTAGAKWEQERSYSEDDLEIAFKNGFVISYGINDIDSIDRKDELFKEWFEQFKKK
jgi:hypothetical protein